MENERINYSENEAYDSLSEECGVFGIYCQDEKKVLGNSLVIYFIKNTGAAW